jgi:hypothetical protein
MPFSHAWNMLNPGVGIDLQIWRLDASCSNVSGPEGKTDGTQKHQQRKSRRAFRCFRSLQCRRLSGENHRPYVVSGSSSCTKLIPSQSHISDQSLADHSNHPRPDAPIVKETGDDQSSPVNSTTGTQMAPMSSDTMLAPETGKTPSFTESVCGVMLFLSVKLISSQFHISDHSATGHSDHRVDDGSHRTGTSITIAGKRTLLHWPFKTQMAVTSPDAMSSSGRTSSPVCGVWLSSV